MKDRLNRLKVSTKIIIPIIFILAFGNIITNYISTSQMQKLSINNAKESLQMLTNSIFITLRNAMNTGDPAVIKKAEEQSRDSIKGLQNLTVAKSKETISIYSPTESFTRDKDILSVFDTKKDSILEFNKDGSHYLRVLRPMIATSECLACHFNQKEGDVVGVIDLTFSLDEADATISETILFVLSISLFFIAITIITVWIVSKKATEPLKSLQNEMKEFFSFLNHERDTIEPFKVHSHDEIGEMVTVLNENIAKIQDALKSDEKVIKEVSIVCEKAALGNLRVNIKAKAANPEINNLVDIVNKLIKSMQYNINRVLDVLNCYTNDQYSCKIESKGNTVEDIKELFEQVNTLGNTLTKLSSQNLKNGKALQQTAKVFSKNVQMLNNSSTEQAVALSKASESLNEVTKHIEHTTSNTKKMAQFASELKLSSSEGKSLATRTQSSMDDINQKVNAINEAIAIIDQIAFQTNILSLNAAVEAATAGEAGKGFAVVAQEVRNLASRSAEAANEIKSLVTTATSQASEGSSIASDMIEGYNKLSENIDQTSQIIDTVAKDSIEQLEKIEDINKAIVLIDKDTQENAKIASQTNIVAIQASDIAQKIVDDASHKEFDGKKNIRVRSKLVNTNYTGPERRKLERTLSKKELEEIEKAI